MSREGRACGCPPSRRQALVALGVGAGGLVARPLRGQPLPPPPATEPPVLDVHCHVFNASDLPLSGFIEHTAPVHVSLVREIAQRFANQINRRAPSAREETPDLDALFAAAAPAGPAPTREIPTAVEQQIEAIVGSIPGLASVSPERVLDFFKRTYALVQLVTGSRHQVAAALVTTYPQVNVFTPCLVDYDAWSGDQPEQRAETPLAEQIPVHAKISKLSIRGKIGRPDARLHPFVPFDPKREVTAKMTGEGAYKPYGDARAFTRGARYDIGARLPALGGDWEQAVPHPSAGAGAIEIVRAAVEQGGFLGVKLYPPVGFRPLGNDLWAADRELGARLDLALRAFYAYCEAEQVPITAHSSAANGYGPGFGNLAAPDGWAQVLAEFPLLRLNLGHFGHLEGMKDARGLSACESWMRKTAVLMQVYPNLYADMSNSALAYDDEYADRYLDYLETLFGRSEKIRKRVMYGSDWFLNRLGPKPEGFPKAFHDRFESKFGARTRRWVMGANALRFLGLLDDNGAKPARSCARDRLRSFYGSEPLPDWI